LRETGQTEVQAPADAFTAEFTADGHVALRVDCNRCAGGYTAGATSLRVGPMACTRAYCNATAPLDSTYESLLSGAETWTSDGKSRLDVSSSAGVLHFQR
jgi:heat shock protein HslJ